MKKITLLLVVLGILMQSFSKLLITINYQVNKEYIAAVLCVNKNKPKLGCQGKCQLAKQMQEDDKRENSPVNPLKEKLEIQFHSMGDANPDLSAHLSRITSFPPFNSSENSSYSFSIFHPPRLLS